MINSVKPILVLLPGLDGTGRLFTPLRRELPKEVEPIVLSYPPDTPLTYDDLCNFLAHELPTDPFVLLGESFGGPLAILLAQRAKYYLKGIILCASFITNPHLLLTKFLRPVLSPSIFRREPLTWAMKIF